MTKESWIQIQLRNLEKKAEAYDLLKIENQRLKTQVRIVNRYKRALKFLLLKNSGMSNKEIAEKMNLSISRVKQLFDQAEYHVLENEV